MNWYPVLSLRIQRHLLYNGAIYIVILCLSMFLRCHLLLVAGSIASSLYGSAVCRSNAHFVAWLVDLHILHMLPWACVASDAYSSPVK